MKPTSVSMGKALAGLSLERFATTIRADFRFAPLNGLLLVAIFVIGLVVHLALHSFSAQAVMLCLGSALCLAVLLRLTQVWEVLVVFGTADCLTTYLMLRPESEVLLATIVIAMLVASSVQIAYEWERAVVVRLDFVRSQLQKRSKTGGRRDLIHAWNETQADAGHAGAGRSPTPVVVQRGLDARQHWPAVQIDAGKVGCLPGIVGPRLRNPGRQGGRVHIHRCRGRSGRGRLATHALLPPEPHASATGMLVIL